MVYYLSFPCSNLYEECILYRKMIEKLFEGEIVDFIYTSLTSTFLGEWLIFVLLFTVTATIMIKTQSFEAAGIANLIIFFAFMNIIPMPAFMIGIVISVLAISYSLWGVVS